MKKFFVYVLVFQNGKFYVGMSRKDKNGLDTGRFRQHAFEARKGSDKPLYRAWREVGDPVQLVVSEHGTRQEAAYAEIETIKNLETTNPDIGYNVALGGQGLHAPKGSAIHRAMTEKVWGNPERNAKLSAALKGRTPSPETFSAFRNWLENGGRDIKAEAARLQMAQPGARERVAENTRKQMTAEAREKLSAKHRGRTDPRTPQGKRTALEKQAAFKASPEGKAALRKGYDTFRANPENVAKNKVALDGWRASQANSENCKRMAQRSAEVGRKPIKDLETGKEYPSQRHLAIDLGVSDALVCRWVKTGKVVRLPKA